MTYFKGKALIAFPYPCNIMTRLLFCSFILVPFITMAQGSFAPDADTPGTTAIASDSSVFVLWATECELVRGYEDIAVLPQVEASYGEAANAIGEPGANGLVSLGDAGTATLAFSEPIGNGPGWDFAVFENSFSNTYLEFGFVEVSSDGLNYVRFPSMSEIQTATQIGSFGETDATLVNNLAGKYRVLFGTPFDLEELKEIPNLNVNAITHVRIVDVVGTIDPAYAAYDSEGTIVNDPYPTPFESSGFDLDAVGVIHTASSLSISEQGLAFQVYPNPTTEWIRLNSVKPINSIEVYSMMGKLILSIPFPSNTPIDISFLPEGNYLLRAIGEKSIATRRITKM